jgi:hypothetical protein
MVGTLKAMKQSRKYWCWLQDEGQLPCLRCRIAACSYRDAVEGYAREHLPDANTEYTVYVQAGNGRGRILRFEVSVAIMIQYGIVQVK